ncbi:MAG: hypothetical protein KGJ50_05945 [Xanthomonadaceae bacterium]|nr:hypothetical protein [Xanthomonadaceae bacterium]
MALRAAARRRFHPARRDGKAAPGGVEVPIRFKRTPAPGPVLVMVPRHGSIEVVRIVDADGVWLSLSFGAAPTFVDRPGTSALPPSFPRTLRRAPGIRQLLIKGKTDVVPFDPA